MINLTFTCVARSGKHFIRHELAIYINNVIISDSTHCLYINCILLINFVPISPLFFIIVIYSAVLNGFAFLVHSKSLLSFTNSFSVFLVTVRF